MRRILLIALVLAVSATAADARRRHHYRWHRAPVMMIGPGVPGMEMPREMRGPDMPRGERRDSGFIPADWKLQAEDPNFSGRRYMAPDGSAWLGRPGLAASSLAELPLFHGLEDEDAAAVLAGEIGRASCRERVFRVV